MAGSTQVSVSGAGRHWWVCGLGWSRLDRPWGWAVLHLASTRQAEAATLVPVSDRQSKLVERDGRSPVHRLLDRQFVVRSTDVLHEGVSCDDDPGAAVLLSLRIGRSLDVRRPWSASTRLLAYCSVRCQAAGSSSSSTIG